MIVMEYAPGGTLFDFIQDRNGVLLEEEVSTAIFLSCVVSQGVDMSTQLKVGQLLEYGVGYYWR